MKDFFGSTVEDYKAKMQGCKESIVLYNEWLNSKLEKIFDPSKPLQSDVFTKKGKLRAKYLKKIAMYKRLIAMEKDSINFCIDMMKGNRFKYTDEDLETMYK